MSTTDRLTVYSVEYATFRLPLLLLLSSSHGRPRPPHTRPIYSAAVFELRHLDNGRVGRKKEREYSGREGVTVAFLVPDSGADCVLKVGIIFTSGGIYNQGNTPNFI